MRALKLAGADAAALAAHYGSVSVVTFAVATATLARQGIAHESHAALWVAVMEAPGLVAGILRARMAARPAAAASGVADAIAVHVLATYARHYAVAMTFSQVSVLRPERF